MPVILNFTKEEKEKLKAKWKQYKKIGKPSNEGNCYLFDNTVYKIYDEDFYELYKYSHTPLCKCDLDLESFIFPTEIYTHGEENYLFGYISTPYVEKDALNISLLRKHIIPDINKIKEALKVLIEDIYVLSRNNIDAIDFEKRNLLFDGNKFYVIDTLDYEIVDENAYSNNINRLIKAIACFIIDCETANYAFGVSKEELHLDEVERLIEYIDETAKKIQEEYKDKEVQKIKK